MTDVTDWRHRVTVLAGLKLVTLPVPWLEADRQETEAYSAPCLTLPVRLTVRRLRPTPLPA